MANPHDSETGVQNDHTLQRTTPRWVKVSVAIVLVLIVLLIILHLSGNGSHMNMHMSMTNGVQPQ